MKRKIVIISFILSVLLNIIFIKSYIDLKKQSYTLETIYTSTIHDALDDITSYSKNKNNQYYLEFISEIGTINKILYFLPNMDSNTSFTSRFNQFYYELQNTTFTDTYISQIVTILHLLEEDYTSLKGYNLISNYNNQMYNQFP